MHFALTLFLSLLAVAGAVLLMAPLLLLEYLFLAGLVARLRGEDATRR